MKFRFVTFCLLIFSISTCQSKPPDAASQHLLPAGTGIAQEKPGKVNSDPIPDIVQVSPFLSKPNRSVKDERFTVVLHDIPVRELLFTLARDSDINIDIHPDIKGNATLNAVEETLVSILERLARQVDFIYEEKNGVLVIRPDNKFWNTYNVDYLSLKRKSTGSMSLALEASGDVEASSKGDVDTTNDSEFWTPIVEGITAIIESDEAQRIADAANRAGAKGTVATDESADEETAATADAGAEATTETATATGDFVVAHQATGVISVFATSRQHKQVQVFFDQIMIDRKSVV